MKKVKITQVKSTIGRSDKQKATVLALGLKKIGAVREHNLTPQVEGMVRRSRLSGKGGRGFIMSKLEYNDGSRTRRKRVGRGPGSGLGRHRAAVKKVKSQETVDLSRLGLKVGNSHYIAAFLKEALQTYLNKVGGQLTWVLLQLLSKKKVNHQTVY